MAKHDDDFDDVDRAALTPRATGRTVLGLVETLLLLRRVGRRPGILADRLRAELHVLEAEFDGWSTTPPTAEVRIDATNRLGKLMVIVHGLERKEGVDEREEPEEPEKT